MHPVVEFADDTIHGHRPVALDELQHRVVPRLQTCDGTRVAERASASRGRTSVLGYGITEPLEHRNRRGYVGRLCVQHDEPLCCSDELVHRQVHVLVVTHRPLERAPHLRYV